jgi:hypothetical protein
LLTGTKDSFPHPLNVLSRLRLAGIQVITAGRFWVFTEAALGFATARGMEDRIAASNCEYRSNCGDAHRSKELSNFYAVRTLHAVKMEWKTKERS